MYTSFLFSILCIALLPSSAAVAFSATRSASVTPSDLDSLQAPIQREDIMAKTPDRPSLLIPGSVYRAHVSLPVLGLQSFRIKILNAKTAHFVIPGVLRLDDEVEYNLFCDDHEEHSITFQLSLNTRRALKQFRASVGSAQYNRERDEAILQVQSPLPHPITSLFQRVQ